MKMTTPEAYLVFITDQKMILGVPGRPPTGKTCRAKIIFSKTGDGNRSVRGSVEKTIRHPDATSPCNEICELRLTPLKKSRRTPFTRIQATIDTLQWLPETIHMEETGGDVTTFHLQFRSINQPLPDRIFDIPLPDKKPDRPEGLP